MADENERRFLVHSMDRGVLVEPPQEIIQGYLPGSTDLEQTRIRIIDGTEAILGRKRGTGVTRGEEEIPYDLVVGKFLLDGCIDFVEKTRWAKDGWEIDFFKFPLEELVLAEFEMGSPNQVLALPSWIHKATEVTDYISSLYLARLATTLRAIDSAERLPILEELTRRFQGLL